MIDRALVVGLGSIGQRHLRLLRDALPSATLMAYSRNDPGQILAGADRQTVSWAEALDFKPQIAVIATPAPFHAEAAMALVRTGTHVLVEKPITADLAQAQALADAAADCGVVLQVGYNLRFLPSLDVFRAQVRSGVIGRIASVRAEVGQYLPDWRPGRDWRKAVSARADLGGGVLLELSHEFDLINWIFGPVAFVRGWAGQQGNLDLDVEDTAMAVLTFSHPVPDGASGAAPVALVAMDFIRRDTVRSCVAIGASGTLYWDAVASTVRLACPGQADQMLYDAKPDRDETYRAQLRAFLASVTDGQPVAVSAADGINALRIAAAVKESHALMGVAIALHGKGEPPCR